MNPSCTSHGNTYRRLDAKATINLSPYYGAAIQEPHLMLWSGAYFFQRLHVWLQSIERYSHTFLQGCGIVQRLFRCSYYSRAASDRSHIRYQNGHSPGAPATIMYIPAWPTCASQRHWYLKLSTPRYVYDVVCIIFLAQHRVYLQLENR